MRRTWRTWRTAVFATLLAIVLAGCSSPQAGVPVPSMPGPTSPPTATAAPGPARALPVYYGAQTLSGLRLYREFHRVPSTDPASDAVREMLTAAPADPDYRSLWPAGVSLHAPVSVAAGVTTVDLAGVDGTQVAADVAPFAVHQLVLTVQGALQSTDPVQLLVQGKPVDKLWNVVPTSNPVPRGDIYALRSLVQIDGPPHGATVGGSVEVTGEAAVFEATVQWQLLRDGAVLRSGSANTTEGQRFAPFRFGFGTPLGAGRYTVRVLEDDPSGGAGRPVLTDDKTFTVA